MSRTVAYHAHDPNVPFVLNDIRRFADRHDRVILFVERPPAVDVRLASNVEVVVGVLDWSQFRPVSLLMRHLASVLGVYVTECFHTRRVLPPVHALRKLLSNLFRAEQVAAKLKAMDVAHVWHYSFWFYDCIFLAWLRSKGLTEKAIARTHGGDLFEERGSLDTKALFRYFQLRRLDRVYSVSETGARYLRERYPAYAHKVRTAFLGSLPPKAIPEIGPSRPLVVVSCARVRNVKRIHLIGEALYQVDVPVRWVHFGDADPTSKDPTVPLYFGALKALAQRSNVEVVSMGGVSNTAILEWYATNPVHLFISMSENEGIPVSMMEAISFGIPVMSTDVGGCSEIVNERTGVLIPKDTSVAEVARSIERFASSPMIGPAYRSAVREYWAEHFDMERNYELFFKEVHGR